MRCVSILVASVLMAASGLAQTEESPEVQSRLDHLREVQRKAIRLMDALRKLEDWDQHHAYIVEAAETLFERNGWDSESDQFALQMLREVSRIPPWQAERRFREALGMISERYGLDEDQQAQLRHEIMMLDWELFSRHADRILEYATEAIETRAAGQPFTPGQIARWTTLAEPVFADMRQRFQEAAEAFADELTPEQRELLLRDVEAADRRLDWVEQMSEKWKRGQWSPADWGMDNDPIQNPELAAAAGGGASAAPTGNKNQAAGGQDVRRAQTGPASASKSPRRKAAASAPADEHPWARYTRQFVARYRLNNEQRQRAWSIYRDARQREDYLTQRFQRARDALRKRLADTKARAAVEQKQSSQYETERQRVFEQMKQRLEKLPTRAQRRAVQPASAPAKPGRSQR